MLDISLVPVSLLITLTTPGAVFVVLCKVADVFGAEFPEALSLHLALVNFRIRAALIWGLAALLV